MDIKKIYKDTAIRIIRAEGECRHFKCVLCPLLTDRLCSRYDGGSYKVEPSLSLHFAKEYLLTLPAEDVLEDVL